MAESINVSGTTKKERYETLIPQIKSLVEGETNSLAALGNIIAALKYGMNFFWVGLYIVRKDNDSQNLSPNSSFLILHSSLVLGPFQGPVACTRIGFGKGVCGTAWKEKRNIIVDDVNSFEGHIACSSESKSEIVLPIFAPQPQSGNEEREVIMVLDVDSENYANFDSTDETYLGEIVKIIEKGFDDLVI